MLAAALAGDNPRPIHERWLMPHMLSMTASQISHPVAMFIEMISDNGLLHDIPSHMVVTIELRLTLFEP